MPSDSHLRTTGPTVVFVALVALASAAGMSASVENAPQEDLVQAPRNWPQFRGPGSVPVSEHPDLPSS